MNYVIMKFLEIVLNLNVDKMSYLAPSLPFLQMTEAERYKLLAPEMTSQYAPVKTHIAVKRAPTMECVRNDRKKSSKDSECLLHYLCTSCLKFKNCNLFSSIKLRLTNVTSRVPEFAGNKILYRGLIENTLKFKLEFNQYNRQHRMRSAF